MFAADPQNEGSRAALLVEQIAALGRLDESRVSARERLEQELGYELAGRLVGALTGDKGMRTARLVA
jgi:hypothetical protein